MKWGQSNREAVISVHGRETTLSLSIFTFHFLIWIRDWPIKNQVWIGNLRRFLCLSGFMQEKPIHLLPLTPRVCRTFTQDFPGSSDAKESACNAGDPASNPESGRSPGKGNGNPLQFSCLGNPMNRGLVGNNPWSCTTVRYNLASKQQQTTVFLSRLLIPVYMTLMVFPSFIFN